MGIALEKGTEKNVIRLDGSVGIENSAELKQVLLEALEPGRQVQMVFDGDVGLDVTAVQMLWAMRCEALKADTTFMIEGSVRERLSAVLSDAGLTEILLKA